MKVSDLINKVMAIKQCDVTNDQMLYWVNELRDKITEEVIDTHEKGPVTDRPPLVRIYKTAAPAALTANDDIDIKSSHMDVYETWLYAKIDLAMVDYDRYTNDLVLFNNAYSDYKKWYNRTHMPLGVR